jgi:prepilin-type processing-associated H-X9-DG protein
MTRIAKICCKSTFIAALFFALTSAALAQSNPPKNLYEALAAQSVRTTIHAAEMTTDWHVIAPGRMSFLSRLSFTDPDNKYNGFFYTTGKLISFDGHQYLVAYRLLTPSDPDQRDALDFYNDKERRQSSPRQTPILLENSQLALALLAFNQPFSLDEIQKFDPAADVVKAPSKAEMEREMSQANLKQIGLAMMMYLQDYDEVYPPMIAARSADEIGYSSFDVPPPPPPGSYNDCSNENATVQDRLTPYTKDSHIFLQPVTGRPYLPNYKVSRKPMSRFKNPSQTFLFYEDARNLAGTRNVVYADGHVQELSEAEFQRERKAQDISESGYPSAAKPAQKAKATPKT